MKATIGDSMNKFWRDPTLKFSFGAKVASILMAGITVISLMFGLFSWISAQNVTRSRVSILETQTMSLRAVDSSIILKLGENDNFHWRQHFIDSSILNGMNDIKDAFGIKPRKNQKPFNQLFKSPSNK
jgi:hypothetical protein